MFELLVGWGLGLISVVFAQLIGTTISSFREKQKIKKLIAVEVKNNLESLSALVRSGDQISDILASYLEHPKTKINNETIVFDSFYRATIQQLGSLKASELIAINDFYSRVRLIEMALKEFNDSSGTPEYRLSWVANAQKEAEKLTETFGDLPQKLARLK